MKKIYIRASGRIEMLKKLTEYEALIKDVREEKDIAYWGSGDGWHDNPGFNQLEQKEFRLTSEFTVLKVALSEYKVWDESKNTGDKVQIGSKVTFETINKDSREKTNMSFKIGGYQETSLEDKIISYNSPIGSALNGKKIGELGSYKIPMGEFEFIIKSIE